MVHVRWLLKVDLAGFENVQYRKRNQYERHVQSLRIVDLAGFEHVQHRKSRVYEQTVQKLQQFNVSEPGDLVYDGPGFEYR